MSNINQPSNIIGMGNILKDDDEDDIDIDMIEKSIVSGVAPPKNKSVDLTKEYGKELDTLTKTFGLKSDTKRETVKDDDDDDDPKNIDDLLKWTGEKSKKEEPKAAAAPYNLVDDDDDEEKKADDYYPSANSRPAWSSSNPEDKTLNKMTTEERKQEHVNSVIDKMDKNDDDTDFIQKEDEEDEMARIVEQVDQLRSNLESEGIDLSRIQNITSATSKKEAKAILRILQIKNDRIRYCDFFEELVLAGAYGLEGFFDGKREVLGSKIDLTGYPNTVKIKLKRMRYDTSSFVGGIMQGYNISPGWRIMLELLPSLFLYSRDRRVTAKDNLISDDRYKKAIQDLT